MHLQSSTNTQRTSSPSSWTKSGPTAKAGDDTTATVEESTLQTSMACVYDSDSIDSSDSEYDSASWSDTELAEDEAWVSNLEKRVMEFSVVGSSPALAGLVFKDYDTPLASSAPKARPSLMQFGQKRASSSNNLMKGFNKKVENDPHEAMQKLLMRKSTSGISLKSMKMKTPTTSVHQVESQQTMKNAEWNKGKVKPDDRLKELLQEQGLEPTVVSYKSLDRFFVEMEEANFAGYDNDIAAATRIGDLDAIEVHHMSGKPLLCCNRFRESTIHTVCRRGHSHLLRYMLEAGLSIQVCCDQGRNPLHDAAWTHQPNFELVKIILKACPDLLYISDNRGYTPLAYVGKRYWDDWCTFLEANRDLLAPRTLVRG